MRARRSSLSVPGSSERMLAKAIGLEADEIVVDLEDSVAAEAKEQARELVVAFLARERSLAAAVAVRVNALAGPWGERDVVELVRHVGRHIGSLVVPKVERSEDIAEVERLLDALGEPARGVRLQALVQTAAGLLHVGEIPSASPRLEALILGYDGPYLEIRDHAGLRLRVEHVRALGFDGKWAVHPDQLTIINAAFTPMAEELARARAILDALRCAEGRGAVELHGEMIDEASRKLALQVIARGRAAGLEGALE